MEQKFEFIEIQKLFTILLWHRLFPVRLYCSMSKLMEFAFLGEEESCWCFSVAHSLSSSPLLKHVDMILRCVQENVSKSTVSSAEVDRNYDISLNWGLRSHGFENILQVKQTETIMKSKEIVYISKEICRHHGSNVPWYYFIYIRLSNLPNLRLNDRKEDLQTVLFV